MWARVDGLRTLELGSPGEMRSRLNRLVLEGTKRATAGILAEYDEESEAIEQVGERLVLIDDEGQRVGVVEVTDATPCRFGDVPWEFAQAEGEGHTDLDHWRRGHLRFWGSEGRTVDDDTELVLLRISLVEE